MKLKPKELCINTTLCLVSERLPKEVRKYFLTVIEQDQVYEVNAPMTEFRCKRCGNKLSRGSKSVTGHCRNCWSIIRNTIRSVPKCKYCGKKISTANSVTGCCATCVKYWREDQGEVS